MFVKSIALALVSFAAPVLADVYITSPTSSSTFTGGQQAVVNWKDDGKSPSVAQWGDASISIFVGNALQQTSLQVISSSVDMSQTSSIAFTPNPAIGPNSDEYFIRIESSSLKSATDSRYPALAFSAKFTLNGMTGTFNSTEQAQIDGQSTAPLQGPTGSAANLGSPTNTLTSTSKTTGVVASPSSSGSTNAAASVGSNCLIFLFVATVAVGVAVF